MSFLFSVFSFRRALLHMYSISNEFYNQCALFSSGDLLVVVNNTAGKS